MCPKARRPVRKNVPWLPCVYVVGPRWHLWRSHRFSPYALVPVSSPRSLRRPSLFANFVVHWVSSTPPKAEIPESMNQTNGAAKPLVCGNECTQGRPGIPPSLPHTPATKDPPSSLNGPRSPTHTPKAYWDPCSRDPRRQMLFGLKQPCQWNSTEFNK